MLRTVEATIEANGDICLLEPLNVSRKCRAIITILDEPNMQTIPDTVLLSEKILSEDWIKQEEEDAWAHLQ